MDGVMLALDPMSLIELQWGPDAVRIELEPISSGTLLRLLAVLEDRGKGARDGAGWHACLAALGVHLDGAPPESARGAMDGWRGRPRSLRRGVRSGRGHDRTARGLRIGARRRGDRSGAPQGRPARPSRMWLWALW